MDLALSSLEFNHTLVKETINYEIKELTRALVTGKHKLTSYLEESIFNISLTN